MKDKTIALVAHDHKKDDLLEWCGENRELLSQFSLCATGTTGRMLSTQLELDIEVLQSGPLGGDQQIGARISEGKIDVIIFFWDPLEAQSHDTDVKALLRIAVVWNVAVACNRVSADLLITSPLLTDRSYTRAIPDYGSYLNRDIEG